MYAVTGKLKIIRYLQANTAVYKCTREREYIVYIIIIKGRYRCTGFWGIMKAGGFGRGFGGCLHCFNLKSLCPFGVSGL